MGDSSMKDTTPDMCTTMIHYALSLALTGNFDQSECAFEKLTRTTEKTWGINSYQLATVFVEQSKARLAEGRHHDTQVMANATNGGCSSVCACLMRDSCFRDVRWNQHAADSFGEGIGYRRSPVSTAMRHATSPP